jgi:hypothetical protein
MIFISHPANAFLNHALECGKCPRGGSIVNPKKEDYCDVGYALLVEYIEYVDGMKRPIGRIEEVGKNKEKELKK